MEIKKLPLIKVTLITIPLIFSFSFNKLNAQSGKQPKVPPAENTDNKKTNSQEKKDEFFLDLKGTVYQTKGRANEKEKEDKDNLDSALVRVLNGTIVYNEQYTSKKGKCVIRLELDKKYKIVVSKKGFVTKFFEVDTKVPENKKSMFSFNFDIDLFADIKGLDVTVLKKPIAKVDYDIIEDHFEYDDDYTNRINFELKKMYKNYYLLQEQPKDTTVVPNKDGKQVPKGKSGNASTQKGAVKK
jgi:hypothetical protein